MDLAQAEVPAGKKPAGELQFQPAKDTKKFHLDEAQPDKSLTIGAGFSSK